MLYSFLNCDLMRVLFVNAMKTELTGSKNQLQLHTSFIVFRWLSQVLPQLRALQFSQGPLHFPLSPCSGVPSLQLLNFPEEVVSQALLMFSLHVHLLFKLFFNFFRGLESLEIQGLQSEAPGANHLFLCTGTWREKWTQNYFTSREYILNYLLEF